MPGLTCDKETRTINVDGFSSPDSGSYPLYWTRSTFAGNDCYSYRSGKSSVRSKCSVRSFGCDRQNLGSRCSGCSRSRCIDYSAVPSNCDLYRRSLSLDDPYGDRLFLDRD